MRVGINSDLIKKFYVSQRPIEMPVKHTLEVNDLFCAIIKSHAQGIGANNLKILYSNDQVILFFLPCCANRGARAECDKAAHLLKSSASCRAIHPGTIQAKLQPIFVVALVTSRQVILSNRWHKQPHLIDSIHECVAGDVSRRSR